jgi:hypothetical protein
LNYTKEHLKGNLLGFIGSIALLSMALLQSQSRQHSCWMQESSTKYGCAAKSEPATLLLDAMQGPSTKYGCAAKSEPATLLLDAMQGPSKLVGYTHSNYFHGE